MQNHHINQLANGGLQYSQLDLGDRQHFHQFKLIFILEKIFDNDSDGLVQNYSNSIANALMQ